MYLHLIKSREISFMNSSVSLSEARSRVYLQSLPCRLVSATVSAAASASLSAAATAIATCWESIIYNVHTIWTFMYIKRKVKNAMMCWDWEMKLWELKKLKLFNNGILQKLRKEKCKKWNGSEISSLLLLFIYLFSPLVIMLNAIQTHTTSVHFLVRISSGLWIH